MDLDAVLDEFEFHEDQVNIGRREPPADMFFLCQAEKQNSRPSPSDTGFFSPTSEPVCRPSISLEPGLHSNIGASSAINGGGGGESPETACLR